jgi:hypothetical protein
VHREASPSHIINLVVKVFLYGSGAGSKSLQEQLSEVSDEDAFEIWRKQGAIGKLHNIIYYITRSNKRRHAFSAVQQKLNHGAQVLQLVRDIGVRWNSTFDMIERALILKPALQRHCLQWQQERGEQYYLSHDFLDSSIGKNYDTSKSCSSPLIKRPSMPGCRLRSI